MRGTLTGVDILLSNQLLGVEQPFPVQRKGRGVVEIPAAQIEYAVDRTRMLYVRREGYVPAPSQTLKNAKKEKKEDQLFQHGFRIEICHIEEFDIIRCGTCLLIHKSERK